MKRPRITTIAPILLAALLLVGPAAGADSRDGNFWNRLGPLEKVVYVLGFFDGQTYAEEVFGIATLLAQTQKDPKTGEREMVDIETARSIQRPSEVASKVLERDFGDVAPRQLVAGLDKIYMDYRNTRIRLHKAIGVVAASIRGETDDSIAKQLERERKGAAQK